MGTTAADPPAGDAPGVLATVHPAPTDEEAAAIVAALQLTTQAAAAPERAEPTSWRFSGRWWTQPIPVRRARPWT